MKRLLDIFGSIIVLIIFAPIMILIAFAIKLESSGPVLFKQERIGRGGANFNMLKFRSMVNNAENIGTGLFSYEDDPRITKVGNFIRRTSLDELPQLLNVISGSMSLVGPRPIVTYEYGAYSDFSPKIKKRFDVKPGITGLAQVTGRNSLTWEEKVDCDVVYVDLLRKLGILIDLKIILKTVYVVCRMKNTIEEEV